MTLRFPSAVGVQARLLAWAMPIVCFLALALMPRHAPLVAWLPVGLTAVVAVMVLWVVNATWYEFGVASLLVRCGPFSWQVPYGQIAGIEESGSLLSGPALSLDRLAIAFRDGRQMLVSPADKSGFLAAMHRHLAALEARKHAV